MRVHQLDRAPLFFGPGPGRPPAGRFDDPASPDGAYGVCYLGRSREAAFAESFLRRPPVRILSRAFVDRRALTTFALARPLRIVPLAGAALAALGATAAVASGPHGAARRWARALWAHPDAPDGLTWRCRHDDDQWAVALFDRAADALVETERLPMRADRGWFGRTLDRYGVALDD